MKNKLNRRICRITAAIVIAASSVVGVGVANAPLATARVVSSESSSTVNDVRLVVSGRREVGNSLSATVTGATSGANVSFQWFRNGNMLQGATGRGRGITISDAGQELMVRATISQPGSQDIVLRSNATIREFSGTPNTANTGNAQRTISFSTLPSVEQQILTATNAARRAHGLSPLTRTDVFDGAARLHSADMALNVGLTQNSSPGWEPWAQVFTSGLDIQSTGENIQRCGGGTPGQVIVARWMNSPGHRRNILNPGFTMIGISAVPGAGGAVYYTQTFGGPVPWAR